MNNGFSGGKYPKKPVNFLYIIIILSGSAAAFLLHEVWLGTALLSALVLAFIIYALLSRKSQAKMISYLERLSPRIRKAETQSAAGFPFPVAVLTKTGKITWYNSALEDVVCGEILFQRDIKTLVPGFETDVVRGEVFKAEAKLHDRYYNIMAHRISSAEEDDIIFVYFIDISESEEIKERYKNERPVEMIISLDNYSEVINDAPDKDKPVIGSEIEKILFEMAQSAGGVIKKTERDKYVLFVTNEAFSDIADKKFAVLDEVRALMPELSIVPTLSIGVGVDGANLAENDSFAAAALDMALGRGGDQAVVRDGVSFRYFGGKTREVEKRTKVRARVVSHALRELIFKSEQGVIMGHGGADVDCVGAGVGLLSYARRNGIRAHMIINKADSVVKDLAAEVSAQEAMQDAFIGRDYARETVNPKTLLIVVDTHIKSLTEYPELLQQTDQIAVIDHHRRAADYIQNPVLLYHEPYASSTCEMVTEILQYISDKPVLSPVEAKALYAGMYMDTKGFSLKTGARTFEAAAFLRRNGAEPLAVKKMFKSDFDSYMKRIALVSSASIYKDNIAIAVSGEKLPQTLVARAADELLDIEGIDTSFVLSSGISAKTVISARSAGEVNVQVILEKLGGGGHITIAGAQLEDVEPEKAFEMLKEAIDDYLRS